MFDVIRLNTVHPALVHFAIGTLPVLLIAYVIGATRGSARWTFVGDVTLWITTVLAVVAAAFGLVAFLAVDWPGGLNTWKWLHLVFGAAGTTLLVVLSLVRMRRWKRETTPARSTLVLTAMSALTLLFGAWIGGEILVFRGGIAVEAAAHGALAPPITKPSLDPPEDLSSAMHRIRAHWGKAKTQVAEMIVELPEEQDFEQVARQAEHLARLGRWVADSPAHSAALAPGSSFELVGTAHAQADEQAGHAQEGEGTDSHTATLLRVMGGHMADQAETLRTEAREHDLAGVSRALGEMGATCANCHMQLRAGHEHAD